MVKVLDNPTPPRPGTPSKGTSSSPFRSENIEAAEAASKEVRALVEAGKLQEARELTVTFLEIWPDDSRLLTAARVLAPPSFQSHKSERRYIPRDVEHEWLRQHAKDYSGQWVALLGDQLLTSGKELGAVMATLRGLANGKEALLHFQPERWNSW